MYMNTLTESQSAISLILYYQHLNQSNIDILDLIGQKVN